MFDLNTPIDETLIPREEQLRRVREQRDARVRDREGLKLSFQRAQIANDAALQATLKTQAEQMTLEIETLEKQIADLETLDAPTRVPSEKEKKHVKK